VAGIVPATTATIYDVFCSDNNTVPTFETLAWTNDTTRATALTTQDGVLVKTGAVTRRYLGSFRTTGVSGQTEDSAAKRYVWNYAHRVRRPLLRQETTASWTYMTATFRQANANTANQVDVVVGWAESLLSLRLFAMAANDAGAVSTQVRIGEDSTTTAATGCVTQALQNGAAVNIDQVLQAALTKYPAVGRHYYTWLEYGEASGTTIWYGSTYLTGLTGFTEG